MSYGTAYHNGADCGECGVRVMWDQLATHRAWHADKNAFQDTLYKAIQDLIEIIYKDHPEAGVIALQLLNASITKVQLSVEGVSSEQ